ncbi:hypothetical protein [Prevotella jejuni]
MGKIYLSSFCPICEEKIFMNSHGHQCECCSFNFTYYICNRYIEKDEAEVILSGERIILDGFSTNSGHVFSSIPVLDGNSIRLDNTIDYISGIGRIIVGNKSFTNSEQPHKLRIQRMYNGHRLTISEIKILLHEGTVLIDTLDEKGFHSAKTKAKESLSHDRGSF